MAATGEPDLSDLPERIRLRIVSLVAEVLPAVTPLPAPLRKVAEFTPARRARLGTSPITAALADGDFRRQAAVQVEAGSVDPDDTVDQAARAWLARPDGWQDAVADVVRRLAEQPPDHERDVQQIEQLRARVGSLQEELRVQRLELRAKVEEAKAENSTLRRRLGESRRQLRAAEEDRAEAVAAKDEASRVSEASVKAAESETRRLRAQLETATSEMSSTRRDARSERDAATVRTRLLLDTLVDSATGLRRELGLPSVEGAPGDAIESDLQGRDAARAPVTPAGPQALAQLLTLPHARLLIDGYNVTKSAWGTATLEAQRSRLVTALAPLVGRTGAETTVVFDAATATSRPVLPTPRGVKVVYSPEGVIADDVICSLVEVEPAGRVVVVVTNDQEVARNVRRSGARVVASEALIALFAR